jgi:GntR family transcriptional regulator
MLKVDRSSPLPLHYQLKQHLLEKIESGEWKPNDLIPSEQEMQNSFGLSRITVRQALSDLVYEGLLIRERGRGTFVAPPKMTHSPEERRSLTEFMMEKGIKPGWQVIEKGFVEANKEVAANLKLPHKTRVYRIRRLRLAAEEAIGQHTAYLPESVSIQINEAVAASDLDVKLLHLSLGSPVLMIQRVVLSAAGEPLEFLQARYRGDRFKYQIGD